MLLLKGKAAWPAIQFGCTQVYTYTLTLFGAKSSIRDCQLPTDTQGPVREDDKCKVRKLVCTGIILKLHKRNDNGH